jgi:hypothetical protein
VTLRALGEAGGYQSGEVGYRGYAKAYGADFGERWCSEFYSSLVGTRFGLDFQDNTSGLILWFATHNDQYTEFAGIVDVLANGPSMFRGDWLAIDADGDGEQEHTAMVLDFDAWRNVVWTLEGNAGNRIVVQERPASQIHGWGHLDHTML